MSRYSFDDIAASTLAALIDEFIHNVRYREVMKDRLIDGLTYAEISEKRNFSERQVQNIVYKCELKLFSKIP